MMRPSSFLMLPSSNVLALSVTCCTIAGVNSILCPMCTMACGIIGSGSKGRSLVSYALEKSKFFCVMMAKIQCAVVVIYQATLPMSAIMSFVSIAKIWDMRPRPALLLNSVQFAKKMVIWLAIAAIPGSHLLSVDHARMSENRWILMH